MSRSVMNLYACLSALYLLAHVLGLVPDADDAFCEKVKLVANSQSLLEHPHPECVISFDLLPYNAPACHLPWIDSKVVPLKFPSISAAKTSPPMLLGNYPDLNDKIEGRMLIVSEDIATRWSYQHILTNLNGRIFGLMGGVIQVDGEVIAFTFNLKDITAHELTSNGRGEKLITRTSTQPYICKSSTFTEERLILMELGPKEALEMLENQDQELLKMRLDISAMENEHALQHAHLNCQRQRRLAQEGQEEEEEEGEDKGEQGNRGEKHETEDVLQAILDQLGGQIKEQRRDYEERKKARNARQVSFRMLLYQDFGPMKKNVDLSGHRPITGHFIERLEFPKGLVNVGNESSQDFLYRQSLGLITLMRLVKHLSTAPMKGESFPEFLFEGRETQEISNSLDNLDKATTEGEWLDCVYSTLNAATRILSEPAVTLSFYDALVRHDAQIKNLFLNPNPVSNSFYRFKPSFNFREYNFDRSALDQLLAYQVEEEDIPLRINLIIDNDQDIVFELIAFIEDDHVLYTFEEFDTFITISSYGSVDGDTCETLYRGDGPNGMPVPRFNRGTGVAFYRYRPSQFKRTKGIIPNV